jgi:hypothetical protein
MIRRESTQGNQPETRQYLMRLMEPTDAEAALVETILVPCKKKVDFSKLRVVSFEPWSN